MYIQLGVYSGIMGGGGGLCLQSPVKTSLVYIRLYIFGRIACLYLTEEIDASQAILLKRLRYCPFDGLSIIF